MSTHVDFVFVEKNNNIETIFLFFLFSILLLQTEKSYRGFFRKNRKNSEDNLILFFFFVNSTVQKTNGYNFHSLFEYVGFVRPQYNRK